MKASEFYEAYRNRHQLAEGWKKGGRRIFGYICNYTPEEIIYAAGIIPVRLRGTTENIDLVDAHLPTFCCPFTRSYLDQALKGRYSYLDGVIFAKTCDMPRVIPGIWKRNIKTPYQWYLPVPGKNNDEAIKLWVHELRLFKGSLEKYTGQNISDESLKKAIKVYNENRSLVGKLYKLGLKDSPPLSGSQMFGILLSGLVMPKEEHNGMLQKLLDGLSDAGTTGEERVRLMIAGNTLEAVELLQAVEENGGDIVIDDLDIGHRYYGSTVDEAVEPLKALAERYLRKVPCPCKHPAEPRIERMLELAEEYRVKGVILLSQKYCDTHLYESPYIEKRLKDKGINVLHVEHSDIGWVGGKFKTMVRAFIEMLGQ